MSLAAPFALLLIVAIERHLQQGIGQWEICGRFGWLLRGELRRRLSSRRCVLHSHLGKISWNREVPMGAAGRKLFFGIKALTAIASVSRLIHVQDAGDQGWATGLDLEAALMLLACKDCSKRSADAYANASGPEQMQ